MYQCESALLCDNVSDCTNVVVLCCVILRVPVQKVQYCFVCNCHCLYQCGSAVLCNTVIACTNVAVLCFVTVEMPEPMWQCYVLCYSNFV